MILKLTQFPPNPWAMGIFGIILILVGGYYFVIKSRFLLGSVYGLLGQMFLAQALKMLEVL